MARAGCRFDLLRGPLGDDLAAELACAGADVDDVVGGADRALVVLDDDHGVADVAQALERADQLLVVALVQADRRLVEDVENADQARADLCREADPLRLAARKRRRRALQREVADADGVEEMQALGDLADDEARDRALGLGQLELVDPFERTASRELGVFVDVEAADRDREHLGTQAGALAGRTGLQRHQRLDALARVLRVRVLVATLEAVQEAVEANGVGTSAAEAVLVGDRMALAVGALEQQVAVALRQIAPRHLDVDAVGLGDRLEQAAVIHRRGLGPGLQRALRDRQRRVGHDQLRVDHALEAEAVALRAAAVR